MAVVVVFCLFFSDDCWRRRIGKGNSGAKNLRHKSKSFHEDMHQLKESERDREKSYIRKRKKLPVVSLSLSYWRM
jgi:hypothetical protein